MKPKTLDYAILDRLALTRKPVGVKFLPYRPEGIERIQRSLNFCQMFVEAQTSPPFYVQKEDLHCVEPTDTWHGDFRPCPPQRSGGRDGRPLRGTAGESEDLPPGSQDAARQRQVRGLLRGGPDHLRPGRADRHDRRHGPGADHHESLGLFDRRGLVVQGHARAGLLLDVRVSVSERRSQLHGQRHEHGHADPEGAAAGADDRSASPGRSFP